MLAIGKRCGGSSNTFLLGQEMPASSKSFDRRKCNNSCVIVVIATVDVVEFVAAIVVVLTEIGNSFLFWGSGNVAGARSRKENCGSGRNS